MHARAGAAPARAHPSSPGLVPQRRAVRCRAPDRLTPHARASRPQHPVPSFDWGFIFKSVFQQYSIVLILVCSTLVIFIIAHVMWVAERTDPDKMVEGYEDCVWVTSVTITTLGYGDMVPKSKLGRFSSFLGATMGLLMASYVENPLLALQLQLSSAFLLIGAVLYAAAP